ncbi:MAG: type II secretion system protein GspN [Thermodesulfobacteriota bacterium]
MRNLYKYPAFAIAALILFVVMLFILIPGGLVEGIVREALEKDAGVTFIAKDFRKGFPLGFKARGLKFFTNRSTGATGATGVKENSKRSARFEFIEMEELSVSLALLPLIIGKKKLSYTARLGGGSVEGEALIGEDAGINLTAVDVGLRAVGSLRALGLNSGRVSGEAAFDLSPDMSCPEGSVSLDATGVELKGLKSYYPEMIFGESASASLAMEVAADCKAKLKGLFIEGRRLNARLAGVMRIAEPIKKSALDMKVEIFLKPDDADNKADEVLLSLIKGYKKSSGYYSFDLKGTLGVPVIKK